MQVVLREEPRLSRYLSHALSTNTGYTSAVGISDGTTLTHSSLHSWIEKKKQQLREDQYETNSLNWNFVVQEFSKNEESPSQIQTISSEEIKNAKSYLNQLHNCVREFMNKMESPDSRMIPVVARQIYNVARKQKHEKKAPSYEKIINDLNQLFGKSNSNITENVKKSLSLATKLLDWIDRFKSSQSVASQSEKIDERINEEIHDIDKVILQRQASFEFGNNLFLNERAFSTSNVMEKEKKLYNLLERSKYVPKKKKNNNKKKEIKTEQQELPETSAVSKASSSKPVHTIQWLRDQCKDICGVADMANNVLEALQKGGNDLALLQDSLFNILGEQGFDLMMQIIESREELLRQKMYSNPNESKGTFGENLLQSVSIRSKEEIESEKYRRKQENKKQREFSKNKKQTDDGEDEEEKLMGLLRWKKQKKQEAKKQASVLDLSKVDDCQILVAALPDNIDTNRICYDGYEEYQISPPPTKVKVESDLIPISEFPDWARPAFKGFERLNTVQSIVYEAAFKTNENLLVCAPTGCGKTNVALMTMLHEIGQHFKNNILRKDEFKIIYVAPMKALAQEMVTNFTKRLAPLGIVVREMTGDMQLTKKEVSHTQLIVTTPEKWDVITRKASDLSLIQTVKLLIIDEVHLLNEDRGPVIETLVARTMRQVESSQSMIRIVGLSATLPNYEDVATFLRVNRDKGLFHFDNSYRPVPLKQIYIGVHDSNPGRRMKKYNDICFEKVISTLKDGHQAMVFVHARKETVKTARQLIDSAVVTDTSYLFDSEHKIPHWALQDVRKSANKELRELFPYGISFHHAGMLRRDRNLVERLFAEGFIKVLCCTATLAWGVNLPAHAVIIKGTEIYDPKKGEIVELGMLDVMQIFGRAGRPQFDTSGEGTIITSGEQLPRYLRLLNHALPIESKLAEELVNHLNAEVVLGTVTNVSEAITWLTYTYMYIRISKNPMIYGISYEQFEYDPSLYGFRKSLIEKAAKILDDSRMCRFDRTTGCLNPTDTGRIASHYYIHYRTIQMFNETLKAEMGEEDIMNILSSCVEFNNVKVRDDEVEELVQLMEQCPVKVKNGVENANGKVNVLIQGYISSSNIKNFALVSDCSYVVQSVGRIVRALFEIALRRGWPSLVHQFLTLGKCIEKKMWSFQHPLRQFPIPHQMVLTFENKKFSMEQLYEMEASEIGYLVNAKYVGKTILNYISQFPTLDMDTMVQPVTRGVLRVKLRIVASFEWNRKLHGDVEPWWIWVEDDRNEYIYHHEYFLLKQELKDEQHIIEFTVPVPAGNDNSPRVYMIKAVSDRWIGAESVATINLKDIIMPESLLPNTDLLPLNPLPLSALEQPEYEKMFNISYLNPIQTQVFHTVYHTDSNILIGAPTGSGKTMIAEMAIIRLFTKHPTLKAVYIAPLKALVRERVDDWKRKFAQKVGKKVVELTGDYTPDMKLLKQADIIICTPEKWDGISRNWKQRSYVQNVGLVIMDEIHLLGSERGPILEVIVSRMRYVAWSTSQPVRLLGLSSTIANAKDLAEWLGIEKRGLYNFRASVRPVPLTVHIQGFPGQHYCPRMATMNKPAYSSILQYSRNKPVLVFVSSRRQTRLTAMDLISFCASDENPQRFVRMAEGELESIIHHVQDANLKHTLVFGIGIHHAGLTANDKSIVEELFVTNKIQVLVCTSTLAWGVNFPAHLVVIKGTEFFDPKGKKYVDYPITDVLQMMGRAGRPQFDDEGKAVIFVQDTKKQFYKRFLYEPFPVESNLDKYLHDHINAEIVAKTICSRQDAVDYLTWTFLFRRLIHNPSYYGIEDSSYEGLNKWLSKLVSNIVEDLESAGMCLSHTDEAKAERITSTSLGTIASYYYMSHKSIANFAKNIKQDSDIKSLLLLISESLEYSELPVRHNEDKLNSSLSEVVPLPVETFDMESPHVKTYLLLQAYFSRVELPISDYITDTKTVLDQTIRIIQAYVDITAEKGYLTASLNLMMIMQMVMQGMWVHDSSLLQLPIDRRGDVVDYLKTKGIRSLPELMEKPKEQISRLLSPLFSYKRVGNIIQVLKQKLPRISVKIETKAKGDQVLVTGKFERISRVPEKAYLPSEFPKQKDEGYWVIIGDLSRDQRNGDLLALKRVTIGKYSTVELLCPKPKTLPCNYTLFLICDSYIGLDQQYDFNL